MLAQPSVHSRALHIIASCTDRKRLPARAEHRLSFHAEANLSERFASWTRALKRVPAPVLPAGDLYMGAHWTAIRQAHDAATSTFDQVHLWVLSAGYGLVESSSPIKSYSATFAAGPDSVVPANATRRSFVAEEWWAHLSSGKGPSESRGVSEIARRDPRASILVVASAQYVLAARADLECAAEALSDRDSLVLVSGADRIPPSLTSNAVQSVADLLTKVGGARISLHARVAADLLEHSPAGRLSARRARARYAAIVRHAPPPPKYDRTPASDAVVLTFIRRALNQHPTVTHSRLLREYRGQGMACEQHRFRDLFFQVQGAP